jgi:hypothetical protein
MSKLGLLCVASCAVIFAAGCDDDDDFDAPPVGPPASGTLSLSWSIDGRQDAAACEEIGAVAFWTAVVDQGFVVEDLRVPCDEFRASLVLYADDFLVRSTLLDDAGLQVVRRVVEDTVVIEGDQGVELSIDFPGVALPPTPDGGIGPGLPGAPDAGAAG